MPPSLDDSLHEFPTGHTAHSALDDALRQLAKEEALHMRFYKGTPEDLIRDLSIIIERNKKANAQKA